MDSFKLISKFSPAGDQPKAIKQITSSIVNNQKHLTLMGVTGSGKTFTLACVIEKINRPILIITHNKTLAGQLYAEFKEFLPYNAVEYFVSYYDYYQPESYIPQTDTYIEKDSSINEKLDRLRLSATSSLVSRRDVLVVASVSCIYNLGSPEDYLEGTLSLFSGEKIRIESLLRNLINIQYERNNVSFSRGTFRVNGDSVDIFPAYKEQPLRVDFFGNKINKIYEFDKLTGKKISELKKINIYPAKHFIVAENKITQAITSIKKELTSQLNVLQKNGKMLEAQRLRQRTLFDLEMMKESGWCHGIENYSRHLSQRKPGTRPSCLIDYFPSDFILAVDESHVTLPQTRGMYKADKSRKETLVEHGFRLPSCLDNRPLTFDEFAQATRQTIYLSATPNPFEIEASGSNIIEQIIRPTGLLDPRIIVKPTKNQITNIIEEIKKRIIKKERILITTITKKMCEQLTTYLKDRNLRVDYIHSEINTIQRTKILTDLRKNKFDTLIGINLLREGLDLPEVSLVVILDADKEGFLRSTTSLIQVSGRCARNINGEVHMYADRITQSMNNAILESKRRRKIQSAYNTYNKITPQTISSTLKKGIEVYFDERQILENRLGMDGEKIELEKTVGELEKEMFLASKHLRFEKAAEIRDKIKELKNAINR